MSNFNQISVLIPTYNRAPRLKDTLLSVFHQSLPPLEIIVVDDGSTDDTEQSINEIKSLISSFSTKLVYLKQVNKGKSAALNYGLENASGTWIAYNDSDDIWLPQKLEKQAKALMAHPECKACFTNSRFMHNSAMNFTSFEKAKRPYRLDVGVINKAYEHCTNPPHGIFMQSLIVHRSIAKKVGHFNNDYRVSQDTDFIFRIGLHTPFCYLREPLTEIDREQVNSDRLTTKFSRASLKRLTTLESIFRGWLTLLPKNNRTAIRNTMRLLASVLYEQSIIASSSGNDKYGRKLLADSFKQYRSFKTFFRLIMPLRRRL